MADRILQVERLEAEKARTNKYQKKEKIAYIEADDYLSDRGNEYFDKSEVNMAELKQWSAYVCKLLKSSNRKNPFEPNKNEIFSAKTYTFDVTKCDEMFDLLVID